MDEQASLLSRLTQVVATTPADAPLTHRLCLALAQVAGLDGGTMTVGYSTPARTMLCASDDVAAEIEELQEFSREGPGLDAHRLGEVVYAEIEDIDRRWPMLAQSFPEDLGLSCLVAAPMKPTTEVLGVVALYGTLGSALEVSTEEIQFLTNAIGIAVLGGFERSDGTDELWSARDVLNQAIGMVVAQLAIRPADAIAVLRAHAFAHETTLGTIADQVVRRSLAFQPGLTNDQDMGDGADGN
jgi:hypothetical protein